MIVTRTTASAALVGVSLLSQPAASACDRCTTVEFLGAAAPEHRVGALFTDGFAVAPGFDIALNFVSAVTDAERAAFQAAEATWESLILGYQNQDLANNRVDITVDLSPIDGRGGILGSAGPRTAKLNEAQTSVASGFLYSQSGEMTFDNADTAGLVASGTFDEVVLHEMGHVLGIGTLWSSSGVGLGGRQELYDNNTGRYTGGEGIAAFNDLFGRNDLFVPVELDGNNPGTANGHWNEVADFDFARGLENQIGFDSDPGDEAPAPVVTKVGSEFLGLSLDDELMTGRLSGTAFLSDLTLGSIRDLGYVTIPEPGALLALAGFGGLLAARRRPSA